MLCLMCVCMFQFCISTYVNSSRSRLRNVLVSALSRMLAVFYERQLVSTKQDEANKLIISPQVARANCMGYVLLGGDWKSLSKF